ncbi:MAG: TolC family protein, partial [Planctomycetota bacterium]
TNEKYLEVIRSRFRRGQASAADVLQQRELIESNRAERVLAESAAGVLANQLAVLLGRPPPAAKLEVPEVLPEAPPLPRAPLPAQWIRRRPDVRAAELRVQAADRRVAAAVADQFPRLALAASADTTDQQIRSLLDNWVAAVLANLTAPLLDGGMRRAEVERTKAVASERLHAYGQVVLTSVREVEDALAREAKQAEYVESLNKQLKLSKQAMEQTLANYVKGAADFTRYLTTLLSHQRLQRTYLAAERDRLLYRIDLCRALAGSWALERPSPDGKLKKIQSDAPGEPAEPDDEEMARPIPRPKADRS